MSSSSWELAWRAAQPSLQFIRNDLNPYDSNDPRITRVGKLDAELLDQELVQLLQEPLNNALALIISSFKARFEPELRLTIQLVLYKLSIWNLGASYGAKLQGLRYSSSLHEPPLSPYGLPRRLLLIHGSLTIVLPYLHSRLRAHALSRAWPDAPSSDRRRKAWEVLTSLESCYTLLGLGSFVVFLYNGRYRTLADRLLGLQLVPTTLLMKRDVSYEFMNRQMVWHAFTEFLLFLLPLINARSIRRRLNRILHSFTPSALFSLLSPKTSLSMETASTAKRRGRYWSLPQDQCAICAENSAQKVSFSEPANALATTTTTSGSSSEDILIPDAGPPAFPIYNPYIASCGDIYCYHCIAERMMRAVEEGEDRLGWECLRCMERVKTAERFVVELEPDSEPSSDYEFSSDFDMGSTDLSGSMGSYTESEGNVTA